MNAEKIMVYAMEEKQQKGLTIGIGSAYICLHGIFDSANHLCAEFFDDRLIVPNIDQRESLRKWLDYLDSLNANDFEEYRMKHSRDIRPLVKQRKKSTNVYLIENKNTKLFKIGKSFSAKTRLCSLRTSADGLRIVFEKQFGDGAHLIEKQLHEKYIENNEFGEWFNLTKTQVEEIILWLESL